MVTRGSRILFSAAVALAASCGEGADLPPPQATPAAVAPTLVTDPVADDPDDPAIWLHPGDPAKSLILGTNKVAAPDGALVVFGLDGKARQVIAGLDRPNNVDVERGVRMGSQLLDIAVVTERLRHRLRVFVIAPDSGDVSERAVVPVLGGETGDRSEPMGIGLYKRSSDGAVFAIVAPRAGGATKYLWQYRLDADAQGNVTGSLVRRFGNFSEKGSGPGEVGEIEAVVVDDELGYVYYADESYGIRKWHADPDHPDADRELAVFGLGGYQLDREGLAVYAEPMGGGYLVSTDQRPGGSVFKLYRRSGAPGMPHQHELVREVTAMADQTDGIEVVSTELPAFPRGILIAMNSTPRNFAIFDWDRLFPAAR